MKTVHLTEEGFAEVAAALEERGQGALMLVDLFLARYGAESAQVQAELAKFERLASAARELYVISTWRSNPRGNAFPAGSVFESPKS